MAKTALITGATAGIGYELSKLFARDGFDLVLVARDSARLEGVAAEMRGISGRAARAIAADLSRADAAPSIFEKVQGVDFLVNNAGFGLCGPFAETGLPSEQDMIQVNVTSLVQLSKFFLKGMLQRNDGRIMNVASTAAFQPGPLMAVYYASKAFVLSFSEAVAEEVRGTNVTVTAFCPGPTATEFQKRARIENIRLMKSKPLGMMAAADAAQIGYRGMMRGKVVVIPGVMNRLVVQSLRISPRSLVRRIARRLQEN